MFQEVFDNLLIILRGLNFVVFMGDLSFGTYLVNALGFVTQPIGRLMWKKRLDRQTYNRPFNRVFKARQILGSRVSQSICFYWSVLVVSGNCNQQKDIYRNLFLNE